MSHVIIPDGGHIIEFDYENYRGEKARRRARVVHIFYGTSQWHPEPQWFCHADDLSKRETRDFAMKDMTNVMIIASRFQHSREG